MELMGINSKPRLGGNYFLAEANKYLMEVIS
jgi:hypothetical protein